MNTFSVQQIRAYERTITSFEKVRYNLLLAQMQSGKPDTYHLIACEMLRKGLIDQIVIFSGNREKELFEQLKTKNMREFYEKYETFLKEKGIDKTEIFEKIQQSLKVIWGPQLKKEIPLLTHEKTLYIWEESHYAQTQSQHPSFILQKIGVPMDGDVTWFEKYNNYFLSVSATPFSEFVDNEEKKQKAVVHLSLANEYKSVKWHLEEGHIQWYQDLQEGLELALKTAETKLGYGLIRISFKTQDQVIETIIKKNWEYILYDQNSTIKNINQLLESQPRKNTIILLKGKCRMGKQVSKQHVLFCFETSKYSKTDTLLQGLLGRCCGYHTNEDILIYLYQHYLESQELQRFVKMYDDKSTTPFKGSNLKKPKSINPNKYGKFPIIPDKIYWTNKKVLIQTIQEAYRLGNYESFNCSIQQEEIKMQINDEKTIFKIHKLNPSFKHYDKIFPKIQESIEQKYPIPIQLIKENEIHLWVHEDGYVYILSNTYSQPTNIPNPSFPSTTRREVFYK
jgi:hypothetical protein